VRLLREYKEDDVAVILPAFHVRPNANRCIIYHFDTEEYASWRVVSGLEGIALTLLDGRRSLKDVVEALGYLFDVDLAEGKYVVSELIRYSCEEPGNEFLGVYEGGDCQYHTYPTEKFVSGMWGNEARNPLIQNKLDVPLSLLFMPSNKCQVDCIYCYSERKHVPPKDHLSVQRWLELIDEAAALGTDIITFSGGDAFTYRGIEALFARMAEKGIKFLVSTKTYISKKRARMLADTGMRDVGIIQISIDGCASDIVDNMMGRPKYAERAFRSIEHLVEAGLFVRTNTVSTPLNILEVPQLVRKLHALGVKRAGVTNYGRSFYRHDASLFLTQQQIDWLRAEIEKLAGELHWDGLSCNAALRDYSTTTKKEKEDGWERRSHCSGGTSSLAITANGDVVLCEQVPQEAPFVVGNVKHSSLMEIWNSPEIERFVYPPRELFGSSECRDCSEFDDCHLRHGRCFRDALFTYRTPYAPTPSCPHVSGGLRMS
jgi:radical SAM protein with 4Fe4S-binding SPASM domain